MIHYATTIFISAFLLFQVQPLISRYILPWFGGTPAVWSVALLFFQAVLLGGYAYAHVSSTRLKPKYQMGAHLALLVGSLILLPIIPPESLKPEGNESPELLILILLAASVGLPYFALSATGPLLQAWFGRSYPQRSPYALYALSNVGSLLALLSYPFVIEPLWGRDAQSWNWSYLFVAFAVLCGFSAVASFLATRGGPTEGGRQATAEAEGEAQEDKAESAVDPTTETHHTVMWIAFAAAGTTMLLAFTNQLCIDIASVPFLWVLPLSLYLASFILTFAGERWYPRPVFLVLLAMAVAGTTALNWFDTKIPLIWIIVAYSSFLFVFCTVCHGEAYRLRPKASALTKFYLCVSLGGVIGGVFVALIAPMVFAMYLELPIGILATGLLVLLGLARDKKSRLYGGEPRWAWAILLVSALGLTAAMSYGVLRYQQDTIESTRNFYGAFRVKETPEGSEEPWKRTLISGSTVHGMQFMESGLQRIPTSYFGLHSGVGLTLQSFPEEQDLKVGVVGLGAGTIATYSDSGDQFRFYEINDKVLDLANDYFFFLENAQGDVEVIIGDARLVMEREEPQNYDVLILDAFSSDSIPVHLLTIEAFQLYLQHLKSDGVLCVHISNRHLNLYPVISRAASELDISCVGWRSGFDDRTGARLAEWVILSNNREFQFRIQRLAKAMQEDLERTGRIDDFHPGFGEMFGDDEMHRDFRLWTDDYSNLFSIVK